MALLTKIKDRVLSILGEDNSDYLDDISAPEEIWNEALWEIAGMMPIRYLLTQIEEPTDLENMESGEYTNGYNFATDDKIVLLVTRTQADHEMDGSEIVTEKYITKPCKEMAFEETHKAKDANSIYFSNKHSPV